MWRRLVAAFGHAPGLWLFFREPLPRALWRPNAIAVALSLAAIAAAVIVAPAGMGAVAGGVTWVVAHMLFGLYLFVRLPPEDAGEE